MADTKVVDTWIRIWENSRACLKDERQKRVENMERDKEGEMEEGERDKDRERGRET